MSNIAERMPRVSQLRSIALLAVVIPAVLLGACASQSPPPPQPIATAPPPPPAPYIPPARG